MKEGTILTNTSNNLLISYSGIMDSQSILTLLDQVEKSLSSLNCSSDVKKRVLGITTELIQNILHHCAVKTQKNKKENASFLLEKGENAFLITASNLIHEGEVSFLKNRIAHLNSCNPEELKNEYQNQLKNGTPIGKNAGLGLIDIIRKSGKPILIKFASKDNNYSLFTVKVLV